MAISNKTRERHGQMALKLLPTGTTLRDYVVGRANARVSRGVVAAVTAFLVVFVVDALVRGVLVFPGVLICYFVFRYTWPLRGIAVSDQGVALMDRSFVHARPSRVITVLAPAELHISESKYRKRVAIGAEVVTLRGEDCRRWAQALVATDTVFGVSVSMTAGASRQGP